MASELRALREKLLSARFASTTTASAASELDDGEIVEEAPPSSRKRLRDAMRHQSSFVALAHPDDEDDDDHHAQDDHDREEDGLRADPAAVGPLVIDLDALSWDEDDSNRSGIDELSSFAVDALEPQSPSSAPLRHLKAMIAAKEAAKRQARQARDVDQSKPNKELALLISRVSAQEALLRQLVAECVALQDDVATNVRYVETEVPSLVASERARIEALKAKLALSEQRVADTIRQGQETAARTHELRQTLSNRKAQIKTLYAKVEEGAEAVRAMSTAASAAPAAELSATPSLLDLAQLLSSAKQRSATLQAEEKRVPWPPISPAQVVQLRDAVARAGDQELAFGRVWLCDAAWLHRLFHGIASRNPTQTRTGSILTAAAAPATLQRASQELQRPYTSPLLALRSYRVTPTFTASQLGAQVAMPAFSNRVAPNTPLCRFELSGVCNDPECPFLHRRDYELHADELLDDLAAYCTPEQVAEARALLAHVADDQGPSPQVWHNILSVLATPGFPSLAGPPRPSVVPRRSYSASAARKAMEQHEQERQQEAAEPIRRRKQQQQQRQQQRQQQKQPADGATGFIALPDDDADEHGGDVTDEPSAAVSRIHDAAVALTSDGDNAAVARLKQHQPHDIAQWLRMVRPHLAAGGSRVAAAELVAQALELNVHSPVLWIVYLLLYLRSASDSERDPARVDALFESAVAHVPSCVTIWQLWISRKESFEARDTLCKRAVLALASEQAKLAPARSLSLSAGLLQMLMVHARLLCESGREKAVHSVLREWTEGSTPLIGPQQMVARHHVNLVLVLAALSTMQPMVMPSLTPEVFRGEQHYLLAYLAPADTHAALAARLLLDEARLLSNNYTMVDVLPLRVNRVCLAMSLGDASRASFLFHELARHCPLDPDVTWLAAHFHIDPNLPLASMPPKFVTAFAVMARELEAGSPLSALSVLPLDAARAWLLSSVGTETLAWDDDAVMTHWGMLLGVDLSQGLDSVLRPRPAALAVPELVYSWLCFLALESLRGARGPARMASMFEDALCGVSPMGSAALRLVWGAYLAFCSGLSATAPFDTLLERARADLMLPACPADWLGSVVSPALPDAVLECAEDLAFRPAHVRYRLHNAVVCSVLNSLPPMARRRAVAEVMQSTPDNVGLVMWSTARDLEAAAELSTQDVLTSRTLVASLAHRNPRDAASRMVLAHMELMLGLGREVSRASLSPAILPVFHMSLDCRLGAGDAAAAARLVEDRCGHLPQG